MSPFRKLAFKAALVFSGAFRLSDQSAYRFLMAGTSDSYAGKTVTLDNALTLSAIWACIRLRSQTVAGLPLNVYKGTGSGKTLNEADPLHNLLRYQPNADMSAVEFWALMVFSLDTWGNAFAEIVRNGVGDIVALLPMPPGQVTVRRDAGGAMLYSFAPPTGGGRIDLGEGEVLHIKGMSQNGIVGMSPITYARHSLGSSMATDEAAGKIFANGLRPSALYSVPQFLTKAQRSRYQEILAEHTGNANRGGFMLLEGDAKFTPLTLPPEDAQLLETRNFNVEEACRWFATPPWMIGHTTKTTSWGAGIEQQMLAFKSFTLAPITYAIEQAIRRCLLTPPQRLTTTIEFDFRELLRTDSIGRAAIMGAELQNGVRSRNEVRADDNLPPIDGGDKFTVQSNLIDLAKLGATPPDQTPGGFGLIKPGPAKDPTKPAQDTDPSKPNEDTP